MKPVSLPKIILGMALAVLAIAFLPLAWAAPGNRYSTTIFVNGPLTNGMTLTVNGDTRTWRTNFLGFSTIVLTNGGPNSVNATNLVQNVFATPFTGLITSQPETNALKLVSQVDQTIAVTIGGGWGTYSTITNSTQTATPIRVPMSAEVPSWATNLASQLVRDLGRYSTNQFDTNLIGATVTFATDVSFLQVTGAPDYLLSTNGTQIAGAMVDDVLLLNGTRPMTGALDAASFNIINMADGVNPQDGATFFQLGNYVFADAQYPNALLLDGTRPMIANLDMNGNRIVNMADGIDPQDAISVTQWQQTLRLDGTFPMTGSLDFGGFPGIDMADPSNPQDAATKAYVDAFGAGFVDLSTAQSKGGRLTFLDGIVITNLSKATFPGPPVNRPSHIYMRLANVGIFPGQGGANNYTNNPIIYLGTTVMQQGNPVKREAFFGGAGNNALGHGINNFGVGYGALASIGVGSDNSAFGNDSLTALVFGNGNSAMGRFALGALVGDGVTGNGNVAQGDHAGYGDGTPDQQSVIDEHCGFFGFQASRSDSVLNTVPLTNAWAFGENAKIGRSNAASLGSPTAPLDLDVHGAFNQIPLSFSMPVTVIGSSNWVTFAHGTVPAGKTVTINYVQSLLEDGTDPAPDQAVQLYDATAASTLLFTNGNWTSSITITNGTRYYLRFINYSPTNIVVSASGHGNMK